MIYPYLLSVIQVQRIIYPVFFTIIITCLLNLCNSGLEIYAPLEGHNSVVRICIQQKARYYQKNQTGAAVYCEQTIAFDGGVARTSCFPAASFLQIFLYEYACDGCCHLPISQLRKSYIRIYFFSFHLKYARCLQDQWWRTATSVVRIQRSSQLNTERKYQQVQHVICS